MDKLAALRNGPLLGCCMPCLLGGRPILLTGPNVLTLSRYSCIQVFLSGLLDTFSCGTASIELSIEGSPLSRINRFSLGPIGDRP